MSFEHEDPDIRAAYAEHLIREAITYATERANMRSMAVVGIIAEALKPGPNVDALRARVRKLTERFPLYGKRTAPGSWA